MGYNTVPFCFWGDDGTVFAAPSNIAITVEETRKIDFGLRFMFFLYCPRSLEEIIHSSFTCKMRFSLFSRVCREITNDFLHFSFLPRLNNQLDDI